MARRDHCYLLSLADGRSAIAFCPAERDAVQARRAVEEALNSRGDVDNGDLSYLGLLDYSKMDHSVADKLDLFEKRDPVWLAFFCKQGQG